MKVLSFTSMLLPALAACNSIFGLGNTHGIDAADSAFYDATTDAPFGCPPIGTVPVFIRTARQAVFQPVTEYGIAVDADRSIGHDFIQGLIVQGAREASELTPAIGLESGGATELGNARITPEGDDVFAVVQLSPTSEVLRRFTRSGETWASAQDLVLPFAVDGLRIGAPSRGPLRRMVVRTNEPFMREIEIDATGTVTAIDMYTDADLGTNTSAPGNLTADGQRMVFAAKQGHFYSESWYADRSSTAARFSVASKIEGGPSYVDELTLASDCGRLYFSAAGSVLFLKQP